MKRLEFSLWLGLAILSATILAPHAAPRPAVELEPYRAFVRTSRAQDLLAFARDAMRSHWGEHAVARDSLGVGWPNAPTALYLSLVDRAGTRACVGRALPHDGDLPSAVRDLAIQALQADTRRPPVRRDELERLRIVIAFAGVGESVADPMEVDPGREGLQISSGERTVSFLPGEARTVSWALREARRIGVLDGSPEDATYVRFPVVVLAETPASAPRSRQEDPDASR